MNSTPKFIALEHTGDLPGRQVGNDYNKQSEVEYEAIKGFIGQPTRLMDLGCGLGRMAIYINWKLNNPNIHFVLADSTEVTNRDNISGWNPGRDFYNNLEITKSFCNENGLTNITLFDVNKDNIASIGKIDLLFSFLAVGFHFPIDESLQKYWGCLHSDSTLIFGVRQRRYAVQDFANYFEECYLIQSTISNYRKQTRKQHYLVLRKPQTSQTPPLNVRGNDLLNVSKRWIKGLARASKHT